MQLIFTGTGGLSTLNNFQTSIILRKNESNFLIDCGTDTKKSLHSSGFIPEDIDSVYISHIHSDHCGGLEYLGINNFFNPKANKPHLVADSSVIQELKKSLVGLKCIKSVDTDLHDFFDVMEVYSGNKFYWNSIDFTMHKFKHIVGVDNSIPTFGLLIRDEELKNSQGNPFTILFTGDSLPPDDWDLYDQADLIIQDCETSEFKTGVHAHYDDLKCLTLRIKRKMVLVHYGDNVSADSVYWNEQAEQDGFPKLANSYGFVPKGHFMSEPDLFSFLR